MKKRKYLFMTVALAMALCMALGVFLPACNNSDEVNSNNSGGGTHSHAYTELEYDENGHWYVCECGEIDQSTVTEHTESETWSYGANEHWKVCTICNHVMESAAHDTSGPDGECSVCGYKEETKPNNLESTTIYMVGDSTMCSFSDEYYIPRYGYGTQLQGYLSEEATVNNLAMSGRSSLSFMTETNYTTLKSNITSGDYLIIGFGHNDEKENEELHTEPTGSYTEEKSSGGAPSFEYNLYTNYIQVATNAGATPILCTPIVRYSTSNTYENNEEVHINSYGDYRKAIVDLGESTGTTTIDLTSITAADYGSLGTEAQWYHAFTSASKSSNDTDAHRRQIETTASTAENPSYEYVVPDGLDKTHLNLYGASMVSYEFVTALKETSNYLKWYVKDDISKPTMDMFDEVYNADFKYLAYESFDPQSDASTTWNTMPNGWYGTVFGDVGNVNATRYTVSYADSSGQTNGDGEDADAKNSWNGTFTVGSNAYGNGKLAGSGDGLAAAFMQISISDDFTATAHVKITQNYTMTTTGDDGQIRTDTTPNQAGFGMMLRDDIYIDKANDKTINSNYVTAGIRGADTSYTNFWREKSTSISNGNDTVEAFSVGSEYDLSITRQQQIVTCTLETSDGQTTKTKVHTDFSFVGVDHDYIYLCLFATRGVIAEFTNVTYEYTGVNTGA